ncbi:MAG: hypothetical protein N2170_06565 [Bacteroidia bacterium]|nr:hypothetical protein [Bacteroidia bacterium]
MNPFHAIAGVVRSAGRRILSVRGILVANTFLLLYAQGGGETREYLVVRSTDARGEVVGQAVCDLQATNPCWAFFYECLLAGHKAEAWIESRRMMPSSQGGVTVQPLSKEDGEALRRAQEKVWRRLSPEKMQEKKDEGRLWYGPNPTSEQLRVQLLGAKDSYEVLVYRLNGEPRLVFSQVAKGEEAVQIRLPEPGPYWLIVKEGESFWSRVVMRE